MPKHEVAIVGAGLVGALLAIFLRRRGYDVAVYERRPDLRSGVSGGGRSINLIATERGIHALRQVGLADDVLRFTVPVAGRMMHDAQGVTTYQPYGRDASECNHSVSRGQLNEFLIDRAESAGARLYFDRRLTAANLEAGELTFDSADGASHGAEAEVIVGSDGAGSAVRAALVARSGFTESIEMLGHGYKELLIPADLGGSLELNALHIWPRGRMMLMALPNLDRSFTVTLYLPDRGQRSFDAYRTGAAVRMLFEDQFADAIPLIPDLESAFLDHPTGELGTVRCAPWHLGGRALLLGDAAHGIVPFFGQGMNSGFEDCTVLDALIERNGHDAWISTFNDFTTARKPDADAIAEMALDNFAEMCERVGDEAFLLRKRVEHRLELEMPGGYRSRYSMVVYSRIPYHIAQEAGRIQAGILDELCAGLDDAEQVDLGHARRLIGERLAPFLERHAVSLDY